jgi:hypothetical protein
VEATSGGLDPFGGQVRGSRVGVGGGGEGDLGELNGLLVDARGEDRFVILEAAARGGTRGSDQSSS